MSRSDTIVVMTGPAGIYCIGADAWDLGGFFQRCHILDDESRRELDVYQDHSWPRQKLFVRTTDGLSQIALQNEQMQLLGSVYAPHATIGANARVSNCRNARMYDRRLRMCG